jgi:hypothetical protein
MVLDFVTGVEIEGVELGGIDDSKKSTAFEN